MLRLGGQFPIVILFYFPTTTWSFYSTNKT